MVLTPTPLLVCKGIDQVLKELDSTDPGQEGYTSGPFTVFSTAELGMRSSEVESNPERESVSDTENDAKAKDTHFSAESGSLVLSRQSGNIILTVLDKFRNDPISPRFKSDQPPQIIRHIDLLPRPVEQRLLLHHWTNFLCWHLVPVDNSDNPFRSVLTPIAMAGLLSPSHQSSGQVALFHAICATSAYSRSGLLNSDAQTFVLAIKHYQLAITHLRHSLKKHDSSQREAILATITMFSAMDMITGRSSEWRTHLQGGASWLATMDSQSWGQDRSSAVVYQSYLAIAALCNINLPGSLHIEADGWLDARFYCLDRFFGLARQTLQHIMIMNNLVKQISKARPDQLNTLEMQLYEQIPEKLDFQDLDPRSEMLSRHHAYVFYYASLIFFQRSVRKVSPDELQAMVVEAVEHLEAVETIGRDVIGCTLVWPPFIVACECQSIDLQSRILAWYDQKRRHGFENLRLSSFVAQEVWKRRGKNSANGDVQWQDVLRDLKLDIVLA